MKCQRSACGREIYPHSNRGGFVIIEARTREGHVVTMPHEWRCAEHSPPFSDYHGSGGQMLMAHYGREFEKRFGYPPPQFAFGKLTSNLIAGFSRLTEGEAAQLLRDWVTIGQVIDVEPLDIDNMDIVQVTSGPADEKPS